MQNPLSYLEGLKQKGVNLGLGPISRLLKSLGNPQNEYKAILIGGTEWQGVVPRRCSLPY